MAFCDELDKFLLVMVARVVGVFGASGPFGI